MIHECQDSCIGKCTYYLHILLKEGAFFRPPAPSLIHQGFQQGIWHSQNRHLYNNIHKLENIYHSLKGQG